MVIDTKLMPTGIKPGTFLRDPLLQKIKDHLDRRMIIICAGPGYGKSTLLAQLIQRQKLPAVYYSLDRTDGDRLTFAEHLLAGMLRLPNGQNSERRSIHIRQLLDHIRKGQSVPNTLLTAAIINHLAARQGETFLVLDDYHHLPQASPVHRLLSVFAERLPEQSHLIIASRAEPALPCLPGLRAKAEVFELSPNDLLVTRKELEEWTDMAQVPALDEKSIDRLLETTEGWITGIQLALTRTGPSGQAVVDAERALAESQNTLFDYFATEIYRSLPKEAQRLLVSCSVLDELDAMVCAAVSGLSHTNRLLERLSRTNQFIAKAGQGFRCHSLFRRFLSAKATDAERQRLHHKAANYYQKRGELRPAVEHLLESGDMERAARAMVPIVETVYNSGRFQLAERWLAKLPAGLIEKSPALLMGRASLRVYQGDIESGRRDLEQGLQVATSSGDKVYQARVLVKLGTMAFDQGRLDEAMRLAKKAQRLGLKPSQRVKAGSDVIICLCHTLSGRYAAAERVCKNIPGDLQQLYGAAIPIRDNYLCVVLTRSGRYAEALERYRRIVPNIEPDALFHPNAGMFLMDAILAARNHGSVQLARDWLELFRRAAPASEIASLLERMSSVSLLILEGKVGEAASIVRGLLSQPDILSRWGYQTYVPYLKARLAEMEYYSGNYASAARGLREAAKQSDEIYERLVNTFRQAMLLSAAGRQSEAVRACRSMAAMPNSPYRNLLSALAGAACSSGGKAARLLQEAMAISDRYGMDGELAVEIRYHPHLKRLLATLPKLSQGIKVLRNLIDFRPTEIRSARISVCLFGGLRCNAPDITKQNLPWQGYKEASLLGFLLLHHGRFFTKDDLARQLWPGVAPDRSYNRLFAALSRMRKSIPHLILSSAVGYGVADEIDLSLDVREFDLNYQQALSSSAPAQHRLQAIRRCLSLYRGPLLPNVGDLWIEPFRHDYHTKYLRILRSAMEAEAAENNWSSSCDAARRILAEKPCDEEAASAMLTGLARMGLRTDMVKSFYSFVQRLRARRKRPSAMFLSRYQQLLT